MARSPIESKKQDIKNSSGGEGWRQRGREVGPKFLKGGVGNIGGLHNMDSVRNFLATMTHKELFWKKDVLIV